MPQPRQLLDITIHIPALDAYVEHLINQSKDQATIDSLTAQLKRAHDKVQAVVDANTPSST